MLAAPPGADKIAHANSAAKERRRMATRQLDTKGLNCPIPVLKARRAMKALAPGDVLEVEATDPGSVIDFRHFCNTTGHELIDSAEADGIYSFHIRKSG